MDAAPDGEPTALALASGMGCLEAVRQLVGWLVGWLVFGFDRLVFAFERTRNDVVDLLVRRHWRECLR